MIFNLSAKSVAFLLAVGVASTTGSNLRQRERRTALFHSHEQQQQQQQVSKTANTSNNLRSSSSSDNEVEEPTPATLIEPSITMNKSTYTESESITVTFSVGSPTHPYFTSSQAPSLNIDRDYPKWSIGLFMRDADPQGGTLAPIVGINVCGALGDDCNEYDRNFRSYNEVTVTFGSQYLEVMQGAWPLEVNNYGTGFDAYVLDGKGAAAIGPLEFMIHSEDDDEDSYSNSGKAQYKPSSSSSQSSTSSSSVVKASSSISSHPLAKFNKGTKKATERQHASVSKATLGLAQNSKIIHANGLEMSSSAIPSEDSIHKVAAAAEQQQQQVSQGTITSNKEKYDDDESVSIDFSLSSNQGQDDLSNYKIGIFMRMAHPQGGALDPVVSLPLCSTNEGSSSSNCISNNDLTSGSVTFSSSSMDQMMGSSWPLDLYQWGTGFDAYILDERGDDVVGPVKFNIMMNDTY
ncbi:hypothetical protein ACHAXR_002425 [Thalassiosira sp. AJA248-18]